MSEAYYVEVKAGNVQLYNSHGLMVRTIASGCADAGTDGKEYVATLRNDGTVQIFSVNGGGSITLPPSCDKIGRAHV